MLKSKNTHGKIHSALSSAKNKEQSKQAEKSTANDIKANQSNIDYEYYSSTNFFIKTTCVVGALGTAAIVTAYRSIYSP